MARRRKASDSTYNARRRERRAAERYLKRAEQATGATAERYREIARSHFENAMSTYDPTQQQVFSGPMKKLATEFGRDITKERREYQSADDRQRERITRNAERRRKAAEQRSYGALEGSLDDEQTRREEEAQAIMSSPVGSRIMGGLVDVWGEYAGDKEAMTSAIYDYFGASSWADVIDKIEEQIGAELYGYEEADSIYEVVVVGIQIAVKENSFTA